MRQVNASSDSDHSQEQGSSHYESHNSTAPGPYGGLATLFVALVIIIPIMILAFAFVHVWFHAYLDGDFARMIRDFQLPHYDATAMTCIVLGALFATICASVIGWRMCRWFNR